MGARRPVEWRPLAEQDPAPGDVDGIRTESRRLGKLATMISEQVERLTAIGRDTTELKGQYAGALRDKAQELSGRLARTHHRYDHVSGYLGHWAEDLADCQQQADSALDDAKEAQGRIDAHQPPQGTSKKPEKDLTDAERSAETARQHALSRAEDALGAARNKLDRAVRHRDERGSHWAGKIERAISRDGLHDSRWDKFKNWVSDHARLLNDLANLLVWVATVCAVIALFIPGLNILAMIALGATIGSLLLHTTTAVAGAGSWIDVGLDVFALATFGLGRLAAPGMRAAEDGVRGAMRGAGATGLGKAAFKGAVTQGMRDAGRVFKTGVRGSQEWVAAQKAMSDGAKAMYGAKREALEAARQLSGQALPKLGAWKNALRGGPEAASLKAYFEHVATRFPGSARIADEIAKGAGAMRLSRGGFAAGMGVDAFDKMFGMTGPWLEGRLGGDGTNAWTDAKTWATVGVGSTW
ncbi:putative T7SS-secreted protein [Streptomyces sp. NPDC054813]